MLRTDTGNFNRFLTSLGLVLLGAALVIPYFYFRNTSTLAIPAAELRQMTEKGRAALEARQDGIVALEPWVIVAAVLLCVIGVVLLVAGALRLRLAQESDDEETELRKSRARLEMEEMSSAEQDERVAEKAEIEEEPIPAPEKQTAPAGQTSAERTTGGVLMPGARGAAHARQIKRVLGRIEKVLLDRGLGSYAFKSQLRIGSAIGEVRMDGLFEATDDRRPDVLLQVLVTLDPSSLRRNARNRADELIATLGRYEALTKRHGFGWLVVVMPDDDNTPTDAYAPMLDSLQAALRPLGDAVILGEADLALLPDLFIQRFGSA